MYKRILIPTDGSARCERAVTEGLGLAKALDARVILLSVVEAPVVAAYDLPPSAQAERLAEHRAAAQSAVDWAAEQAFTAGVEFKTIVADPQNPAKAIHQAERDADLVVMATHGRRGLDRLMLGSVTEEALRRATRPYLVIRDQDDRD